ncbi:MAG: GAF domain-containing protein, partial [Acidimicrobiia bacterium]|nr:GAF domain-containing protein [Acidimicrobiia bacterium]
MPDSAGTNKLGNASPFAKWETWGLALPPGLRARLVHSWLRARIAAATAFTVAGAALGLFWDWPGAFAVAGIASLAIVDAWTRMRRRAWRNPIWSVLLDITLIYSGMGAASVPDSAFGIPYVYMLVSALLLLNPPSALVAIAYASAAFPLLVNFWPDADPSTTPLEIITAGAITDLVLALGLLGLIMTTIRVANHEARRRAHQARLQSAIARASNALLSGSGDNPIETSLYALLDGTDAAAVFVEMNVDQPQRGLCTSLIAEVTQDYSPPDPDDLWKMVSWTEISGRELLESGLSHVVRVSELDGEEKRLYAESDIRSELDIPIFVAGKWWGLVGFGDTEEDRSWLPSDETLLFTAAEMIGAFVERAEARDELNRTIDDLDLQLRYQNGLAECAALLQTATETDAVGNALAALLGATQAAYVYLEERSEDGEPSITHSCGDREAVRAAAAHRARRRKDAGAGTRSASATAKAVDERHGAPRIPTGLASQWELRLPIAVQGEQRASIVFADHSDRRAWTD